MHFLQALGFLPRFREGAEFAAAEPSERQEVELLIDIEPRERRPQLLHDRIVRLFLQHIDFAIIRGVGPGIGICRRDLLVELTRLHDDEEHRLGRDRKLVRRSVWVVIVISHRNRPPLLPLSQ